MRFRAGGRRILAPTGPNGYSFPRDDQLAIDRFIQNFAWTEVRNYSIRIESWMSLRMQSRDWDDEVEIYDLRGKRLTRDTNAQIY